MPADLLRLRRSAGERAAPAPRVRRQQHSGDRRSRAVDFQRKPDGGDSGAAEQRRRLHGARVPWRRGGCDRLAAGRRPGGGRDARWQPLRRADRRQCDIGARPQLHGTQRPCSRPDLPTRAATSATTFPTRPTAKPAAATAAAAGPTVNAASDRASASASAIGPAGSPTRATSAPAPSTALPSGTSRPTTCASLAASATGSAVCAAASWPAPTASLPATPVGAAHLLLALCRRRAATRQVRLRHWPRARDHGLRQGDCRPATVRLRLGERRLHRLQRPPRDPRAAHRRPAAAARRDPRLHGRRLDVDLVGAAGGGRDAVRRREGRRDPARGAAFGRPAEPAARQRQGGHSCGGRAARHARAAACRRPRAAPPHPRVCGCGARHARADRRAAIYRATQRVCRHDSQRRLRVPQREWRPLRPGLIATPAAPIAASDTANALVAASAAVDNTATASEPAGASSATNEPCTLRLLRRVPVRRRWLLRRRLR